MNRNSIPIRLSYGSASLLELIPYRLKQRMETLYAMVGERCVYSCQYCTQSSRSTADPKYLSRISWPSFDLHTAVEAIWLKKDQFRRICLQVVSSPASCDLVYTIIPLMVQTGIPVSLSIRIHSFSQAQQYMDLGVDRLGFSIDVIDPQAYLTIRGGSMEMDMELLFYLAKSFPGKLTAHLIIGLGETQSQTLKLMQQMIDHRITIGLFAFTPMPGTPLSHLPPPPLSQYRQVQLAYYEMKAHRLREETVRYQSDGSILSPVFKTTESEVRKKAFQTCGCAHCTRLYYNDRPNRSKEPFHHVESD